MSDASSDPGDSGKLASGFTGIGQVSETAVRLTGVDGAAVALLSTSAVRELVYATDMLSQQLDELQFTLGEGPCIDAYDTLRPQLIDDLGAAEPMSRWPVFAADATAMGAASIFAYPIASGHTAFGVLELYRLSTGRLGSAERAAAQTCALAVGQSLIYRYGTEHRGDYAERGSGALLYEASEDPSRHSPFTRADVYVAAGMVAVQLAVSDDDAVDRLRAYAYRTGRPVRDVADDIIARRLSLRDDRDSGGRP